MPHPYDQLVSHLQAAMAEMNNLQMTPGLSKGRVGEIILAHHLGHTLHINQRGADGVDEQLNRFEYKVSHDNQYNFNFGHARGDETVENLVTRHFNGLSGAYCALMEGPNLVKVVYCPSTTLVPVLQQHLTTITGNTFQKVFNPIERFAALQGAQWILGQAA